MCAAGVSDWRRQIDSKLPAIVMSFEFNYHARKRLNMKAGKFLFWTATIIAAVILLLVVYDFMYGLSANFPVVDVAGLVLAAVIWLIGLLFRLVLRER